jgi:hypothetical protein
VVSQLPYADDVPGADVKVSPRALRVRSIKPATGGVWSNFLLADEARQGIVPPTNAPMVYMLDLTDVNPTVEVLERFLLPLAQDFKLGRYGDSALVVSTRNSSVRRFVELLAAAHSLPIYVASSTAHLEIAEAEPAGELTATEKQTLSAVSALGGRARAAEIADRLHLQHTAAVNRLVSLTTKGYLYRESQPGRGGDVFVDPRQPSIEQSLDGLLADARHDLPADDYRRIEEILLRSLARRRTDASEPSAY